MLLRQPLHASRRERLARPRGRRRFHRPQESSPHILSTCGATSGCSATRSVRSTAAARSCAGSAANNIRCMTSRTDKVASISRIASAPPFPAPRRAKPEFDRPFPARLHERPILTVRLSEKGGASRSEHRVCSTEQHAEPGVLLRPGIRHGRTMPLWAARRVSASARMSGSVSAYRSGTACRRSSPLDERSLTAPFSLPHRQSFPGERYPTSKGRLLHQQRTISGDHRIAD